VALRHDFPDATFGAAADPTGRLGAVSTTVSTTLSTAGHSRG